jgi:hypothetical protein
MSVKKPVIDLGYRQRTHVIAAIKGERRRSALGRLHPSFMGGEHLPDRRDTEVEIARINIDSTTSDVTSVYTKAGKGSATGSSLKPMRRHCLPVLSV